MADAAKEEWVMFMTTVAGQVRCPQNGRTLVKTIAAAGARGARSVWATAITGPRAQDAHYYTRYERVAQGVEPAHSFTIRARKPEQLLLMDQVADKRGSGTFKITSRQTFRRHGVIKVGRAAATGRSGLDARSISASALRTGCCFHFGMRGTRQDAGAQTGCEGR